MKKKLQVEAKSSLEKLDELTKDILKNSVDGGDANFRHIVFAGLTQTKNEILLEKMKELLFRDDEEDLKKTIILGIFNHKEMFEPILEYGESEINIPYIDESYDNKESYLLVLDALIEIAYKNNLNKYDNATQLLMQIFKIACSAKSSSLLADKLLQRFLNSRIGTVNIIQKEFEALILDESSEVNEIVIALNILGREKYPHTLSIIEKVLNDKVIAQENLSLVLPIIDISTLLLEYFKDAKYNTRIKKILAILKKVNFGYLAESDETIQRIIKRIKSMEKNFK